MSPAPIDAAWTAATVLAADRDPEAVVRNALEAAHGREDTVALLRAIIRKYNPHVLPQPNQPIWSAVAGLRPSLRLALLLHDAVGLDYAAAGAVLGCSPRKVGLRIHKARRRIAKSMGDR